MKEGFLAVFPALLLAAMAHADESSLWGKHGELWTPESRLPDFSWAGYKHGEPLPNLPKGASIRDFGALGDGTTDDTAAFQKALAEAAGAVEVPPGRYVIRQILEIRRSNVVLRGAGPDKSILVCPVPLQEIKPDWSATTAGQKTSNYSWSGGIVWIKGDLNRKTLAHIAQPARRGAFQVQVDSPAQLHPGQNILVFEKDTEKNTLADHLYSGDPDNTGQLKGSTIARLACRIVSIHGSTVQLERPLRFDLRPEWKPEVQSFEPSVTGSGVEHLGFEFPDLPYGGHFTEMGYNAVAISNAADCWVRDIRLLNADSGLFIAGYFCTVQDVVFTCRRKGDKKNRTGHHGIYFGGDDNLFTGFDYQTCFIHDISVSHCAGNVAAGGKGIDLCLDHHKRAPYENLFTNLDAGEGSRLWACGGGGDLGKHCAARGTFWNIRAKHPLSYPPEDFAPWSINLVGLSSKAPSITEPNGKWWEVFPEASVQPADLYEAQRRKRLGAATP